MKVKETGVHNEVVLSHIRLNLETLGSNVRHR